MKPLSTGVANVNYTGDELEFVESAMKLQGQEGDAFEREFAALYHNSVRDQNTGINIDDTFRNKFHDTVSDNTSIDDKKQLLVQAVTHYRRMWNNQLWNFKASVRPSAFSSA